MCIHAALSRHADILYAGYVSESYNLTSIIYIKHIAARLSRHFDFHNAGFFSKFDGPTCLT